MKRTLTAPECLAYFFKTREKFNAGIVATTPEPRDLTIISWDAE